MEEPELNFSAITSHFSHEGAIVKIKIITQGIYSFLEKRSAISKYNPTFVQYIGKNTGHLFAGIAESIQIYTSNIEFFNKALVPPDYFFTYTGFNVVLNKLQTGQKRNH